MDRRRAALTPAEYASPLAALRRPQARPGTGICSLTCDKRRAWPISSTFRPLIWGRWSQRHQTVQGEDRVARGHDGPVDRLAWVVAGLERLEPGRCPLCHVLGCGQAGSPCDVLTPRAGRVHAWVDRLACGLGEQVRPAPWYDVDQVIPPAAGEQPASVGQVVGER